MRNISASDNLSLLQVQLLRAANDLVSWPSGWRDYGTREPGSIPGWAPNLQCFSLLFLALINVELLQKLIIWNYKSGKNSPINVLY